MSYLFLYLCNNGNTWNTFFSHNSLYVACIKHLFCLVFFNLYGKSYRKYPFISYKFSLFLFLSLADGDTMSSAQSKYPRIHQAQKKKYKINKNYNFSLQEKPNENEQEESPSFPQRTSQRNSINIIKIMIQCWKLLL